MTGWRNHRFDPSPLFHARPQPTSVLPLETHSSTDRSASCQPVHDAATRAPFGSAHHDSGDLHLALAKPRHAPQRNVGDLHRAGPLARPADGLTQRRARETEVTRNIQSRVTRINADVAPVVDGQRRSGQLGRGPRDRSWNGQFKSLLSRCETTVRDKQDCRQDPKSSRQASMSRLHGSLSSWRGREASGRFHFRRCALSRLVLILFRHGSGREAGSRAPTEPASIIKVNSGWECTCVHY